MEKIINKSMQTNKNIENFKKTIAGTNDQLKKTNENLLWKTENQALKLAEKFNRNQCQLKKTLKNDIKNEILEEVKDSITEEIHNHMNKLKDENKEVRHSSMQSTFIF